MNNFYAFFKKSKVVLGLVIILLVSLVAVGCGQDSGTEQTNTPAPSETKGESSSESLSLKAVSWGSSSVGSAFYAISIGMGELLNKKLGLNTAVEPLGGSDANMRALINNKVDIAMLNASSVSTAFLGIDSFAENGQVPARILAQGQDSYRNLVVREDAGIKTPADLKGKTVIARRKANPDMELMLVSLLKAYGLEPGDVKIVETAETNAAIEALKLGTAQSSIIPGGVGASFLMDLSQSTAVNFLSIPDDKMESVLKGMGAAFHKSVIPANTYKGQTQDVAFPAVSTTIGVLDTFPEDVAYAVTKTLMESKTELAAVHSEGKSWSPENTLSNPPAPFHAGAVKYFKEAKLWTSDHDKIQEDLLKVGK